MQRYISALIRDLFHFSQREYNGFAVLVAVMLLLLVMSLSWSYLSPPPPVSTTDTAHLDSLTSHLNQVEETPFTPYAKKVKAKASFSPADTLFTFNPNTLSSEGWQKFGVPNWIAKRIQNYLAKGGQFRKRGDLAKIYGFDQTKFEELSPYIDLPEKKKNGHKAFAEKTRKSEKHKARKSFRPAEKLFPFDPNQATAAQWDTLGVPDWIVKRIQKYLQKGGTFRKKEDLATIYDFDPEKYQELAPFITLPKKQETFAAKETTPKKVALEPFDLNSVDTTTLKRIRGIGSGYAKRIVKLREELGGFYRLEQVQEEVYRFPPQTFTELRKYAYISPNPQLQKLYINRADLETLKKHRYLRYKQAQVILRYRREHGSFKGMEELRKVRALSPDLLDKLAPYLSFDP